MRNRVLSSKGFTLVELIAVMSILAVVTGVVVASFSAGMRVLEAATGFNRGDAEVAPGIEILQKDLMNSFAFYSIDFEGDDSRISFATLAHGGEAGHEYERISRVEYFLDRNKEALVRRIAVFPPGIDSREAKEETIIDGLDFLKFSYFEPDSESGGQWVEVWEDATNLPAAVQARIGFGTRGAGYEFRWARRVGAPGELK